MWPQSPKKWPWTQELLLLKLKIEFKKKEFQDFKKWNFKISRIIRISRFQPEMRNTSYAAVQHSLSEWQSISKSGRWNIVVFEEFPIVAARALIDEEKSYAGDSDECEEFFTHELNKGKTFIVTRLFGNLPEEYQTQLPETFACGGRGRSFAKSGL